MVILKNDIPSAYADRLKELFCLVTAPLQPLSNLEQLSTSQAALEFVEKNSINLPDKILPDIIPGVHDEETFKHEVLGNLEDSILDNSALGLAKKRQAEPPFGSRKSQKLNLRDYPSRLMPSSGTEVKKSRVGNLKTHVETLDEKTNEYLNKPISDLDIISLPEHYPTDIHNVSSLAELYYLTQTLPLMKLLPGSHKTLMTENFESALLEGKIAVLYSRIEELKRQKKWSLRQPIRYYDPFLYTKRNKKSKDYTWDLVLKEGKWMATDFKEALKFKKACCITMAQGIQDYWTYGKVMCVKRKEIIPLDEREVAPADANEEEDKMAIDASANVEEELVDAQTEVTQDLVDSKSDASEAVITMEEEPATIDISELLKRPDPSQEIVPPVLPEFTAEDLAQANIDTTAGPFKNYVNINDLKKIDKSIIRNLPKFTAFDDESALPPQQQPLKTGETSIIPASRMLYPMENDDAWYKIVLKDTSRHQASASEQGPPEYQKGLFGVQSHRRFNFLRPPKPPLIKNIEYRSPTIWTPQDDRYLIHYVAEYCFNWDLIAENLSSGSATLKKYESNIERRTPWHCFERYIQLNEKFQFSDMKGHNAYLAQQWLEHAHKAQSTTKRRISPLGVGNESIQRGHRRLRWASMFDAMRKAMRKRETAIAKANSRKTTVTDYSSTPNGNNGTPGPDYNANAQMKRNTDKIPTPSELSKLKFDRDKATQEAYMSQQATRNKMNTAVNQQKAASGQPLPNSSPSIGGPTDMSNPVMNARRASNMPVRPQSAGAAGSMPGGQFTNPQMGIVQPSASTQQQQQQAKSLGNLKRPTTPNGTPYTVEQIQRFLQLQKQRKLMQQQVQSGKGNAMPGASNALGQSVQGRAIGATGSPSMSQAFVGSSGGSQSGVSSPSPMNAQMKRTGAPPKGRLQFAPAQVSAIINSIQQKNPTLTKDQVTKLAATYLANLQQQQQNKMEQQQFSRTQGAEGSSVQQNMQARQAQISRQRLAAQASGKEVDQQTLSKMQYEERKKLMMQQGGSQFGQAGSSSSSSPAISRKQTPNNSSR